jgi:hypothetical protein
MNKIANDTGIGYMVRLQTALRECGVSQAQIGKLCMRRDLTPEKVRTLWEEIKRDQTVNDHAAVLVHRLEAKRFA